jgi:hypothetical protein
MKAILFSCILIVACIFCYGNIQVIDVNRLPEKDSISTDFEKLARYEPMVIAWSPEWKYEIPKKTIADFLETFYKKVCAIAEKNKTNMKVLLLKAVLEHYQYNLDIGDYFYAMIKTIKRNTDLAGFSRIIFTKGPNSSTHGTSLSRSSTRCHKRPPRSCILR